MLGRPSLRLSEKTKGKIENCQKIDNFDNSENCQIVKKLSGKTRNLFHFCFIGE